MRRFSFALVFAVLVVLCVGESPASHAQVDQWAPPPEGVVHDKKTAIAIAHAVWTAYHPDHDWGSEASWQKTMVATAQNGTWNVGPAQPPRTVGGGGAQNGTWNVGPVQVGGGFYIQLAQSDARVLAMYYRQ